VTTAVYPGSFDPITLGHVDIVTRASQMFDTVVMAIVKNPGKQPKISLTERIDLVQKSVAHLKNVEVQVFEGLTVNLAKAHKAKIIIRGLRAVSDFEYEFSMSQMNKHLCPDVETIFMMAGLEYQFLSSSMTNEVARLGGNITGLVPEHVQEFLSHRHKKAGAE
jgi:pantetheine-phosphate adenylyltransferase